MNTATFVYPPEKKEALQKLYLDTLRFWFDNRHYRWIKKCEMHYEKRRFFNCYKAIPVVPDFDGRFFYTSDWSGKIQFCQTDAFDDLQDLYYMLKLSDTVTVDASMARLINSLGHHLPN